MKGGTQERERVEALDERNKSDQFPSRLRFVWFHVIWSHLFGIIHWGDHDIIS